MSHWESVWHLGARHAARADDYRVGFPRLRPTAVTCHPAEPRQQVHVLLSPGVLPRSPKPAGQTEALQSIPERAHWSEGTETFAPSPQRPPSKCTPARGWGRLLATR